MINYILNFIIGISLFLFGINNLTKDLKNTNKNKINKLIKNTYSQSKGILIGTIITMIIQSSSFVTVLLVSLVDSGIMTLESTIGIIMGSNIGTCITSWILSLANLNDYASFFNLNTLMGIIAIISLILFNKNKKHIANITISIIILVLGMNMMSESLLPFT